MTYNEFFTAIASHLAYDTETNAGVVSSDDDDFNAIFPSLIEYAENRCYRALDLPNSRKIGTIAAFTANARTISAPADLHILQALNCITPSTASTADSGKRNHLKRVSLDFLEAMWPNAALRKGVPEYVASLDNETFVVAPTPDAAYKAEWRYVYRRSALSSSNTTTILSTVFPDLLIAAGMVYGSGWTKNFGQQSDDPAKAMSWEAQFNLLTQSALVEVARMKAEADPDMSPSAPPAQAPQA